MANKYLKTVLFIILFMTVNSTFSQGPPPPPPPFPIDGGIFALFAAGIIYGIGKLRNKK